MEFIGNLITYIMMVCCVIGGIGQRDELYPCADHKNLIRSGKPMKKIMLVGRTGAGKTSFCQAIYGEDLEYKKTQAVQIINNAIDTPGEFVENRTLYRALVITAADADMVVLVQDCTDDQCMFAPGFAGMFGKPAIGIVSKVDLAKDSSDIHVAEEKLELAGCERIFHISHKEKTGLEDVKAYIGIAEGE